MEDLRFVVNGNNQITRVISQYQTRESYGYDQNGYISQQVIHTDDYRYNDNDPRSQIKIDNHDLYQAGNKLNRIGNHHYSYDKAGRLFDHGGTRFMFYKNPTGAVGYNGGKATDWVRIEMTNAPIPTIHSFPASLEQVIKYIPGAK